MLFHSLYRSGFLTYDILLLSERLTLTFIAIQVYGQQISSFYLWENIFLSYLWIICRILKSRYLPIVLCWSLPVNASLGAFTCAWATLSEPVLWLNQSFWFLLWLQDITSAITIREVWKTQCILLTHLRRYKAWLGPQNEITRNKRESEIRVGVLLSLGWVWGCPEIHRWTLFLVNFKNKGSN